MVEVVKFLEVYMDQFHHGKEEGEIFPRIEAVLATEEGKD